MTNTNPDHQAHYRDLRGQLTEHSNALLGRAKDGLQPGAVMAGQWGPVGMDVLEMAKQAAGINLLISLLDDLAAEDVPRFLNQEGVRQ